MAFFNGRAARRLIIMEESSEEESVGASSADDTEEESGGSSSENGTERAGSKRLKLQGKEDRISALPDSLIHHVLSFLPSTKEAIQTGILSKRWQNQWTRVPVLIFDSTGKSDKNFSQFIDRTLTLHDCSKIQKFHIQYDCDLDSDPQLTSKIRFATRKYVEELILHLDNLGISRYGRYTVYKLPKFLSNNASLVKLELFNCNLRGFPRTNWPRLKELKLDCFCLCGSALENVVSGSPLLESLELIGCNGFDNDIASKSLKRLIFINAVDSKGEDHIKISCPNLEELSIKISENSAGGFSGLPYQMFENVLSGSPLLHTLELLDCVYIDRLVIASKSLKKLVLGEIYVTSSDIEIACPDLEEANLYHFVPHDFCPKGFESKSQLEQLLAMKILGQLQHVKLLEIGSWFIKILSALEVECLSSPLLNCKCLTVDGTNFDDYFPGIVCALSSSPVLEKFVIKLKLYERGDLPDLNKCSKKNYWNSNGIVFNCSVSNLKTIKIVGLSKRNEKQKLVLNFVEFVLKNARVLEKIVVILANCGKRFLFEVSKKLLSFPRCSPHTTIEWITGL